FGGNRERHVWFDIDARVGPGLIGVNGDGPLAPLPRPRPAASLAVAIDRHVDAEGAAGVARLPVIDWEIEDAVAVSGEFSRTAYEDRGRIRVLPDGGHQSAVVLLRHGRVGVTPPLQAFRPCRRPAFEVDRSAGLDAHTLAAFDLNLRAIPLIFEPHVERRGRLPSPARRRRRIVRIARRAVVVAPDDQPQNLIGAKLQPVASGLENEL